MFEVSAASTTKISCSWVRLADWADRSRPDQLLGVARNDGKETHLSEVAFQDIVQLL